MEAQVQKGGNDLSKATKLDGTGLSAEPRLLDSQTKELSST